MDIDQEKRMAGDYEIIHALHIGDREIVLGENPSAPEDERYVCAFCQQHEIFANSVSYTHLTLPTKRIV